MKLYKGFDKDLKCRGYQFEVGEEYEEEKSDICKCGFHACENPLDVFNYYPPADSRYCEVDLEANGQREEDSKRVGKHIKIQAEIGLPGIIKAGVEYIKNQIDWDNAKESNTGNWSAATNTGDRSAATVTGKESVAMAIGYDSKAKGSLGCYLVLSECKYINGEYHIIDLRSVKVDGATIKANTFYKLVSGEFIEVVSAEMKEGESANEIRSGSKSIL